MELLKIYNDQIEQENKATENEQIPESQNEESKQSQTQAEIDKLTVETLMNQLNEKDRMLQDFKQNTEYYGKCTIIFIHF